MDRPDPLITVVVYARNHEPHVVGALESVYGQDHDALELVVVDDGSSDRTVGMVRDYLDQGQVRSRFRRVEVIELTAPGMVPAAINRGIRESRGHYLNPLIGDERFAPGRLSALLRACTGRGAGLAFSRVEPIAGGGAASAAELEHVYSVQDNIEFFPTVGYALLRDQCSLSSGNLFFSRALFERVGDFASLPDAYDWDFLLRCLLVTEPMFVPDPLYSCRLLGRSAFSSVRRGWQWRQPGC